MIEETASPQVMQPRRSTARRVRHGAVVRPSSHYRPSLWQTRLFAVLAVGIMALVLVHEVSGLDGLRSNPVTGSDYIPVSEYVAARHKPGEPVFVAIPPPAYLALKSRDDLIFVSSPLDRERAQRYTRLTSKGVYV